MREECKLKLFENEMLRKISGLKRDEVSGEWGCNLTMNFLTYMAHLELIG
jgi:hypothetical protein